MFGALRVNVQLRDVDVTGIGLDPTCIRFYNSKGADVLWIIRLICAFVLCIDTPNVHEAITIEMCCVH